MRILTLLPGLAALMLAPGAVRSEAAHAGHVEVITSNQGHVDLIRGGSPVPVGMGTYLYAGDMFKIIGNAEICIQAPRHRCLYKADSLKYQVPAPAKGDPGPWPWDGLFGQQADVEIVTAMSRGQEQGGVLSATPFLPGGAGSQTQYVPAGYTELSPVVSGALAGVTWRARSAPETSLSLVYDEAAGILTLPEAVQGPITVVATDTRGVTTDLWTVTVGDSPPRPDWLPAEGELTAAQRIQRAAWIIGHGPIEWRLFAVTELAHFSREGDYEADYLFNLVHDPSCLKQDDTCRFFEHDKT